MLKEIFICPQVFTEPTINRDSWKDVKHLLENILNSGYVIGLKRKKWVKDSNWNISKLEPKVKDQLLKLILVLKDRERIVDHPVLESNLDTEADWLNAVLELNHSRPLYAIFSTQTKNDILSPEYLEHININEEYGLTGTQTFTLSPENIKKLLIPFLSYAKKITVIDPYFYIDTSETENSLRIIAKLLGERRGLNQSGSIVINCSSEKRDINSFKKTWKNILLDIKNETGHVIVLNIWGRREDSKERMHERYLITNQSGLVSGAGSSAYDFQESEWSIKKFEELESTLARYKTNSSPFNLICKISTEE